METIPHNNLQFANQTTFWSNTDAYSLWQKNMQNWNSRQQLINYGWVLGTEITYQYNSHGFRCKEFDQEPCYLALGCSHTQGVGLPLDQTWPFLLGNTLDKPILNLGVGGSSFDTCVRILDHYIDKLNVQGVFLLQPAYGRMELFNQFDFPNNYLPADSNNFDKFRVYMEWLSSDKNIEYNVKKNTYSINYLCSTKNISCFIVDTDAAQRSANVIFRGDDLARDLMHGGYNTQRRISNLFCDLI